MKGLPQSLVIAFSTYSILPMPQVSWAEDNRRYALCFFPVVGVFIGGSVLLLCRVLSGLALAASLSAALLTLLPLVLSGGIHMDGFMDTCDALASRQPRERKLEILKDSAAGAFGVMACGAYLLLTWSLWAQVLEMPMYATMAAAGFVLSRSMSGFFSAILPSARSGGMLSAVARPQGQRAVRWTCGVWMAACACLFLWLSPVVGGAAAGVACLWSLCFRRLCLRGFGGITGDLAGFYLQGSELLFLAVAAIGGVINGGYSG